MSMGGGNAAAAAAAAAAALVQMLETVPSSAIPSILECVLSSTGISPSCLFESILLGFSNRSKVQEDGESNLNYMLCFATALSHLVKKSSSYSDPNAALQSFIHTCYVPIMNKFTTTTDAHHHHTLLNQIAQLLSDVVIQGSSWDLIAATLVPYSLSSLVGPGSHHQQLIHPHFSFTPHHSFSPYVSCHILTSLLAASSTSSSAHFFFRNLLWDMSAITIQMLSHHPISSSAIHHLLPSILTIFSSHSHFQLSLHGEIHLLSRSSFFQKIWNCCRTLLSLGTLGQRDAYAILSFYLSFTYHKQGCQDLTVLHDDEVGEFDIRNQQEFWDEIKRGLVNKEAFVRKQSLNMLKKSLPEDAGRQCYSAFSEKHLHENVSIGLTRRGQWAEKEAKSLGVGKVCNLTDTCSNDQQRWDAFVLLYEMLDEYGTHLVEAAWNHQISMLLLFPSPQPSSNVVSEVHQSQMKTLEGMFSWLTVLWERGLCHENPQVRSLIMQSILSIDWKDHGICTELVPESFINGPFIEGLNDNAHHKEFGVKGVYSSKTIEGASTFLSQFCKHLNGRKRIAFMCNLVSMAERESFGRAGLMAFSSCIASAAYGAQCCEICSSHVDQLDSVVGSLSHYSKTDLLDMLRLVMESCRQHFNLNYRRQVCENILEAASSVICTSDMPLETLMHFISVVPREFTDYGGSLRGKIQKWFLKSCETLPSSDSSSTRMHALHSLRDFPKTFVVYHHPPDAVVTYDDGDFEAWGFEAQRWARVLLLVFTEECHLEIVFNFLQNYGTNICRHNNFEWLSPKFLILNLSLVQELQTMQMKFIGCGMTLQSNKGSHMGKLDHLISTDTSAILEKFTSIFFILLEEIVSFAKSACSSFWCSPVLDLHLPPSVLGKLGGPSQRRLASCTTTAVLEAILSMKTVATLSSWCAQFKSDNSLDYAFDFLWSFSQNVILSSKDDLESETGAEISLAAYEALVPVLKALDSSMTSKILKLIRASDKLLLPEAKHRHWIETLLLCFLRNINELLAVGTLARSRRAILMNWKWRCLNSMLSILYWMVNNEVHFGSNTIFVSAASLKHVCSDLIGSLENANERSVLPMLRSIRLVFELFASGRLGSTVLSSDGINVEMIWDLVNSSWILHVSCNKRRLAHIAALLSSVLHCSIFCHDMMHETIENVQGPCKWFIEKILNEGTKSPRTIRLAALHLTGLWLLYPKTIRYYIKELKLLSLYGSVAFDEDFEAELSDSHDARIEVALLAKGSEVELTEAFMNTELYARVSVAVLFQELANLTDYLGTLKETEDCHAALCAGKFFLLELLDSAVNDKDLAKELYKKYSGIHRRKARAWQMICILSRFVDDDIVQQVASSLHTCLYRNNMPSVRQYLEIFAVQLYLKFPSMVKEQLCPILRDYNMRPQALSSYVFIAANTILHAADETIRSRHLTDLLPPITPLLTSHHHSLRGFSQLLVFKVLSKMVPALNCHDSTVVPLEKRCFDDLKSYLEKNSDCLRLRTSMEGFLGAFDSNISATPTGIFTPRDEGVEFECVPLSLMEQVNMFLNEVREDLRCSMAKDTIIIKNESLTVGENTNCTNMLSIATEDRLPSKDTKDMSLDFQKKITLSKLESQHNNVTTISGHKRPCGPLAELEKEDLLLNLVLQSRSLAMETMRGSRQDFILVASLLDRIPNIAGLARTCEVFTASGLTVSDASVLSDRQFQLISVTAEKWVPIIEVPVSSIKVFLKKKKQEGFSILGLEQTANSIPLNQYAFPKKMVLVLGHEKEGIPVDIIHTLDACVEIPQLGVVRSLNVHVSGAIALWEYTRQQISQQHRVN